MSHKKAAVPPSKNHTFLLFLKKKMDTQATMTFLSQKENTLKILLSFTSSKHNTMSLTRHIKGVSSYFYLSLFPFEYSSKSICLTINYKFCIGK